MIILLTGPTGTGKTDTSWALLQQFDRMVFLDCDWFASRVPFSWENESDVISVFQSLSLMIEFHLKRGDKNFVIPLTLEMAKLLKKNEIYFSKWNLPIKSFRLRCSEQELAKRIGERNRIEWQKDKELNNFLVAQKRFDLLFPNDDLFKLIDNTQISEDETAIQIATFIKSS